VSGLPPVMARAGAAPTIAAATKATARAMSVGLRGMRILPIFV
jgi:hypothetical protein